MKSKILLAVFMCLLVCLLAVSVSATVTTYDDEYAKLNKQIIKYNENELAVFDDGFVCPSSYIFADSESFTTDYSFLLAMTGKTYTDANVVELCVPEGVTSGGYFKNDSNFTKLVKLDTGKTLTKTNGDFWHNQTLKRVVFGTGFTNEGLSQYFFNGTKVEYVIFSDNSQMTTLPAQFFGSHTTLKGIYLGNTITKIGSGTFQNMGSSNVFLMNTPSDTEPSQVYFFKAAITEGNFYGLKTNATTKAWVFPKGVNGVGNDWNIDSMSNPPKNLVFLTDAQSGVTVYNTIGSTKLNTMNIYFPNMDSSNASSISCSANTTVFFGDSKKITYNGSWGEAVDMSAAEHIYNPQADVNREASCSQGGLVATYCFCGNSLTSEETAALGHLPYDNPFEIVYLNGFLKKGESHFYCNREGCKEIAIEEVNPVLTARGYSVTEASSGLSMSITSGFALNKAELENYESVNGKFLKMGIGFTPVTEELMQKEKVEFSDLKLTAELRTNENSFDFAIMDFKVVYSTDKYVDSKIIACAYIDDGEKTELVQSSDPGEAVVGGMQAISYSFLAGK